MTMKEYFGQAYRIDRRINSKVEQVSALRELAAKATSTLSKSPPSGTRNVHRMEDIIVKIVDMENEINIDIDGLVNLKREIIKAIKAVNNPEQQMVLELRYLCFKTWEEIASEMNYSVQQIYRIRDKAFNVIAENVSKDDRKC